MRTLSLLLGLALCGCSLGNYVGNSSSDYNETLAEVSNKQLAINILRARDNLPLEFSDLSQIRGSIQATASLQSSFPFGPLRGSTMRGGEQGTASVQLNPTFDIAPLNTQDFTRDTLTPVDSNYISSLNNQGLYRYNFFPLFLSSIEELNDTPGLERTVYQNIPCYVHPRQQNQCPAYNFRAELDKIFATTPTEIWIPWIHSYDELVALGGSVDKVDPKFLPTSSASSSSPQFVIKPAAKAPGMHAKTGQVQIYQVTRRTAICRAALQANPVAVLSLVRTEPLDTLDPDTCKETEVVAKPVPAGKHPKYIFDIRSAQAMISYLGQLLRQPVGERAGLAFDISDQRPQDPKDIALQLTYAGKEYYVKQGKPLFPALVPYGNYDDDTMAILSIVTTMLNSYKNASEIPATKAVQGVP